VHSPFDLLALLLVTSAGLAYLNYRVLKLPLTERVTARQRARCEVRSLLRSFYRRSSLLR
jgi:hypothetical protein